jgi:UDP-3-O-[3-hydroxymyristoyl] glucosamine N-acyltransferase
MEQTASELAVLLEGTVSGNPDARVRKLGKIESAGPGAVTFLANDKYEKFVYDCGATIVVVGKSFQPSQDLPSEMTLIKVADPYRAFARLLDAYDNIIKRDVGIHASAIIHKDAVVGKDCYVGPGVVIEEGAIIGDRSELRASVYIGRNVSIGSDCLLFSGARILDRCLVGNMCTIQSNTVVGSEGFGFAPKEDGSYAKVPQTGNVIIEDNCDIGAMCALDRATLGSTIIRKGCKLDNLIQVAHNVVIGEKTVIAAQTGIAGSTIIGANCLIGGQVGFVGHLKIADGTKIAAKAGVSKNVAVPDTILQGIPAVPIKTYQRFQVALRGLVRQYQSKKDDVKQDD